MGRLFAGSETNEHPRMGAFDTPTVSTLRQGVRMFVALPPADLSNATGPANGLHADSVTVTAVINETVRPLACPLCRFHTDRMLYSLEFV